MSKFHRLIARVRTCIFRVKEFKAGLFYNFLLYSVKGDFKLCHNPKLAFTQILLEINKYSFKNLFIMNLFNYYATINNKNLFNETFKVYDLKYKLQWNRFDQSYSQVKI